VDAIVGGAHEPVVLGEAEPLEEVGGELPAVDGVAAAGAVAGEPPLGRVAAAVGEDAETPVGALAADPEEPERWRVFEPRAVELDRVEVVAVAVGGAAARVEARLHVELVTAVARDHAVERLDARRHEQLLAEVEPRRHREPHVEPLLLGREPGGRERQVVVQVVVEAQEAVDVVVEGGCGRRRGEERRGGACDGEKPGAGRKRRADRGHSSSSGFSGRADDRNPPSRRSRKNGATERAEGS
jgi:hypothetical protein